MAKRKPGQPPGRIIRRHYAVEYHRPVKDGTYKNDWRAFDEDLRTGFEMLFGVSFLLVKQDLLNRLKGRANKAYPKLRRSAARMFVEGLMTPDLATGEPVSPMVQPSGRRRLEVVLQFLDFLETVVYQQGMDRLWTLDTITHPRSPYKPFAGLGNDGPMKEKAPTPEIYEAEKRAYEVEKEIRCIRRREFDRRRSAGESVEAMIGGVDDVAEQEGGDQGFGFLPESQDGSGEDVDGELVENAGQEVESDQVTAE